MYYVAGSVLHIVEPEFTLRNACDNAATRFLSLHNETPPLKID